MTLANNAAVAVMVFLAMGLSQAQAAGTDALATQVNDLPPVHNLYPAMMRFYDPVPV